MGSHWDKFCLLMWKNYKTQVRHPFQTVMEILAPAFFALLLVVLRNFIQPEKHNEVFFTPYQPTLSTIDDITNIVAWSPSNPILEEIMDVAVNSLNVTDDLYTLKQLSFKNSIDLNSYLDNEVAIASTLAAVVFEDSLSNMDKLVPNINVTLRFPAELRVTEDYQYGSWKTNLLSLFYQDPGPRDESLNDGGLPGYNNEGFLALQQQLSFSIIKYLRKSQNLSSPVIPPIYMQRFPYPSWKTDKLMKAIEPFIGMVFLMSYVYTCINITKMVTIEKEKQLKEAMKIMGLPNWLHWSAWLIKSFICVCLTDAIMVAVLQTRWFPGSDFSVFTETNPSVLFLFLLSFSCSIIGFSFAVSAFFSSANTAATIAGLLWFLLYVPFYFISGFYERYTFFEKLATCLCSNSAMAYGFRLILLFERTANGMQWNNVWIPARTDEELTLGHIMNMLVFDGIMYFVIALYVEAVFPGSYGVPNKWYFPFTYSYWCGHPRYAEDPNFYDKLIENENFEAEPTYLQPGVKIKQLRKVYRGKKVAVDDLTLNMYKDQITVLLGHNGAGKTTTMSMITGMFPPTSGTAIIGGCDIRNNLRGVRESLGLCPQHNILFDELTVSEHLYFYSRLKGMDNVSAKKEISKYVGILELQAKINEKVSTLSGGMKRKLSVAVALCGNSKVVMLDEPTAGMDPTARRVLWDLLQSEKQDRTILLTTHFMDEADLLGDRIAIMSGGRLQCCGSSFFLKKKYGAGYHLIMDKSPTCVVEKVTELLGNYIPNIKVECNAGSELSYLLHEEYSYLFEEMLSHFEQRAYSLGINSYGISLTTLEEVFMKVGADSVVEDYQNDTKQEMLKFEIEEDYDGCKNVSSAKLNMDNSVNQWNLWVNQVQAMFMKRFLSLLRIWYILLIQMLIPITFVIFVIIIVTEFNTILDLPKLPISLETYNAPVTVVSESNNSYATSYTEMFKEKTELTILESESVQAYLFDKTKSDTLNVRQNYIVAATFHPNQTITAWFNNILFHSAPLSLQLALNAILHKEVSPEYSIQINNHPFPYSLSTQLVYIMEGETMGHDIATNIAFSMAFVSSFYVLFYVKERVSKAKHLQFVSGMNVIPFWLPSFVTDMLTLLLTFICLIATLAPFQVEGFSTLPELGRIFLILLVFGFSVLPTMYLISYLFDNASSAYIRVTFFNIFTGAAAYLVIQILKMPDLDFGKLSAFMDWTFLIFPHYSLAAGIHDVTMIHTIHSACNAVIDTCLNTKLPNFPQLSVLECKILLCQTESKCCKTTKDYFGLEEPGILRNILILITTTGIAIFILLCIEYGVIHKLRRKIFTRNSDLLFEGNCDGFQEDSDVLLEKQKILSATPEEIENTCLVMRNVTKHYGTFPAVNGIWLTVNQYDCFGLLGVNGAGKTTTFKMMTGDIKITSGNAWVFGLSLKTDMAQIKKSIGYCPQFDALLEHLTVRETLVIFGLIRGIPKDRAQITAVKLARDFDFYQHLNKKVGELSGGNKRKLSTALALIGDPTVLYLDEPTTGMDPATKRYLWNCICKVRDSGKCIILTSHSMEECEALCTRLAIMVNGRLMCLGSTQHLKNKFSNSYTLIVKVKRAMGTGELDVEQVESYIMQNFPSASVREKHRELITFNISNKGQSWSTMFGIMERGKQYLNIEDYSLGQCSLEQVFLTFTKYQVDD